MNNKQTQGVEINAIKHLAIRNNRSLATDEELEKIDVTPLLWQEIKSTLFVF